MDALFTKIIEKTELKNWTLFLFIFAISFTIGLRLLTKQWFHLPENDFNQTTLFLLEVFLSSLTITRILVAIKFLEAINRTPIIADFINWIVVERQESLFLYQVWYARVSDGMRRKPSDKKFRVYIIHFDTVSESYDRLIAEGVREDMFVKNTWLPVFDIVTKDGLTMKSLTEGVRKLQLAPEREPLQFKLNPALYRHLDKEGYGFWLQKRDFCLEHFLMSATIFLIGSGAVRFLEWVIGHFL